MCGVAALGSVPLGSVAMPIRAMIKVFYIAWVMEHFYLRKHLKRLKGAEFINIRDIDIYALLSALYFDTERV